MRILMLDNEFPPLGGGTGVVNLHLLAEMARYAEVHVDLVTSARQPRGTEEERFSERIRIFKVPVDNRDIHHSTHAELLRYSRRGLVFAERLLADRRYDLSFAFSGLPAGGIALVLAWTHGLPYIVSLQGRDVPGFDASYPLYPLLTPLIRLIWQRSGAVIAISEMHRRLALRTMPRLAVSVIHNAVDTDLFRPAASRPKPPEALASPLRLLCVGRLVERKGHRHLLRAFAEVRRHSTRAVELLLAGQGEIEGSLRMLAQELGVDDAVRFLGYVTREDIAGVYREADVFTLPSQNEGMSIALLEAMASGLPVVVTRAGGTAELVRDGVNGLIVPWADVNALATALGRFVNDEDLRCTMARINRQRAEEFSWPAVTRQYLDVCEAVASDATRAPRAASAPTARHRRGGGAPIDLVRSPMTRGVRVCILASQYFAWGKYGGFGSMSRKLAESLAASGHRVSVIVPRRTGQSAEEIVAGVRVLAFAPLAIGEAVRLLRGSTADVFHSQDPTVLTWLAQKIHPERAHLITCRDPRDRRDWWIEFALASRRRRMLTPFNYFSESGFLVRRAVERADGVYCPAHFLLGRVERMFHPRVEPAYLPNLIDVPVEPPRKAETPTFLFLARWDRRKRPELFLRLAERFPQYRFIAAGEGEDARFDGALRSRYAHLPNLELLGFVDRFADERLTRALGEAWALVSTAAREGLPLSFLEAAAQGCAIVSSVDSEAFATRFGVHAGNDDFDGALAELMRREPLALGRAAHAHVRATCETSIALAAHVAEYEAHVA